MPFREEASGAHKQASPFTVGWWWSVKVCPRSRRREINWFWIGTPGTFVTLQVPRRHCPLLQGYAFCAKVGNCLVFFFWILLRRQHFSLNVKFRFAIVCRYFFLLYPNQTAESFWWFYRCCYWSDIVWHFSKQNGSNFRSYTSAKKRNIINRSIIACSCSVVLDAAPNSPPVAWGEVNNEQFKQILFPADEMRCQRVKCDLQEFVSKFNLIRSSWVFRVTV